MAKQVKKKQTTVTSGASTTRTIRMLKDVKYYDTYLCKGKEYDIELRTAHTLVEKRKATYV